VDWAAEAALDASIRFDAPRVERAHDPSAVLLTGATGFLGSYLLAELLQQTRAVVYCLVRAPDADAGRDQLRKALEDASSWSPPYASRIVPVPGELAEPLLGLSTDAFGQLARTVDVIFHSGALANFVYPYAALRAINVGGTREVIRLATQSRMKPVHFTSTLGLLVSSGMTGVRVATEEISIDHPERLYMGFTESKYVAERMLSAARREGLPVTITRIPHVTGQSRTGAWRVGGLLTSLIKAIVDLGAAPTRPRRSSTSRGWRAPPAACFT
jgi:thioester reductase-like protein